MRLNTWSTNWNGHNIEVRNYCVRAELFIDGEIVDSSYGLFGAEMRGRIARAGFETTSCPNVECRRQNASDAVYCGACGHKLERTATRHEVRASIEVGFVGICQIFVDGAQVFRGGM